MQKHHYIPQFYLKQWVGADGRLCEYSRPRDRVKAQMKHPSGTGYVRGLYTLEGAPPNIADAFENKFLSIADGQAADALRTMLNHNKIPEPREKAAWTRFIMTLLHRTPEGVARNYAKLLQFFEGDGAEAIRSQYDKIKGPNDPATAEEFIEKNKRRIASRSHMDVMLTLMQSEMVGDRILNMRWHLGRLDNYKHSLLTSDRPIVMTNGIATADTHMIMPLSPRYVLVIAGSDKEAGKIIAMSNRRELVARLNDRMARQARKFVYGADDRQLRFVENRLGEKMVWSPFE